MNQIFFGSMPRLDEATAIGLDVALKACVLWFAAAAAARFLGERRALARAAVWHACLVGWILLPWTAGLLPRLRVSCLPGKAGPLTASAPAGRDGGPAAEAVSDARSLLEAAAVLYEEAVTLPRGGAAAAWSRPPRATEASAAKSDSPPTVVPAAAGQAGRFNWRLAVVMLYGAGASFLAIRFLISFLEARRLGRGGFALAGPAWEGAVGEWRRKLGVRRLVRVECTSAVSVPVALGWLRPRILIPPCMLRSGLRKHRDSVLAHELAHVRRGDYFWQLLSYAVRILYWPHPLAWLMARSLARAREETCDDISVFLLRSARRYRVALVRMARLAAKRPALTLGIAMARSLELEDRIGRIEAGCLAARCLATWPVRGLLAAALVVLAGGIGALELVRGGSDDAGAALPTRVLAVRVVDRGAGAPIAGAWVAGHAAGERVEEVCAPTDADGRTRLALPGGAGWQGVIIRARRYGFAPLRRTWREETMGPLPDPFVIGLDPAAPVGGTIVDREGRPIEGAQVRIWATGKSDDERVDLLDEPFLTDHAGRWRCDLAPAGAHGLQLRVSHPQYIGAQIAEHSAAGLHDRTHVIVLERGPRVEGRVLDAEGRPVTGASVLEGSPLLRLPYGQRPGIGNAICSGPDGTFHLACVAAGQELQLTVEAPGHAPALTRIAVTETTTPLEIRLERGRVIRGRVLDGTGKPVEGALVEADTWRRSKTLDWSARTDAGGRFVWNDGPGDSVFVMVSKRGYLTLQEQEIAAREEDQVIVLDRVLRVRGRVLDAATGAPVPGFRAVRGTARGATAAWEGGAYPFQDGRFDLVFPRPRRASVVKVEAEGYVPLVSRAFDPGEGHQVFDFRLEHGNVIRGMVKDGSGQPVEGAGVAVLYSSGRVNVIDGKLDEKGGPGRVKTGADGSFVLNPQEGDLGLLVIHERGFALRGSVDPAAPLAIALQPWGRVEGELRLGGRGIAGEKLLLAAELVPDRLSVRAGGMTADGGRFTFEKVIAGRFELAHEVNIAPASKKARFESTRGFAVDVVSGATARVVLGGGGRSVIGRMVKSATSTGNADWSAGHVRLYASLPSGSAPAPHYATPLHADGSFRIDDVPPGAHRLSIAVYDRRFNETGLLGQELASLQREIGVSPPAGEDAAPHDLGALEVVVHRELKEGDPAPSFSIRTIDGQPLRLEDFRGKVVLLDFWATWCGPCVAQTPFLEELHETFAKDGGFVIIGLSLDEDAEALRKYAARKRLPWVQGFLGEWNASSVRADYGISSIPRMVLIGRDGRIIARDILGAPGLKTLVAEVLTRKEGS